MVRLIYIFLMMFVCTASGCVSEDEPQGPSLSVGDSLPQFSVVMNDSEVITTNSLKGKIAVIVFFNTGCSDCRKELPVIQKLWEEYKDNPDVKIVPIAREESSTEILEYWKEHDLSLPFSSQENREVYNLFAPSVIPRIYVADAKGEIMAAYGDTDMPSLSDLISDIATATKTSQP